MNYFDAISIQQDLIVSMQYADAFHKTPAQALKKAAEKYSIKQFQEAYKIICAKLNEDKKDLKQLFELAVKSTVLPDEDETEGKK